MMRCPDHQATPMNAVPFATLPLRPELLASIATLDYDSMTPVQARALPQRDELRCRGLPVQTASRHV